jgi:hypothetical protein
MSERPRKSILEHIQAILTLLVSVIAVLVSFLAILFSINPPLSMMQNQNLEQRAMAGDEQAQMHLAHFNYVTGNYPASIFYHNMVINNTQANDTFRAIAYNNLGHLYMNQMGVTLVMHMALEEGLRYLDSAMHAADGNIKVIIAQNVLVLFANNNLAHNDILFYAETVLGDTKEDFQSQRYEHVGTFMSETELATFSLSDNYFIHARATTRIYETVTVSDNSVAIYNPFTSETRLIETEFPRSIWTGDFNFVYDVFRKIDSQFINFNHHREG